MEDRNKRIIDLTVGELLDLLERNEKPPIVIDTVSDGRRFVYGLAGIAELFGCSKKTASRLKQSGRISGAITQVGSLIITNAEKALELAGKK